MTEYHYLFLIALGWIMIGWGTRGYADDDVTIYQAPAAAAGSASSTPNVARDGMPVVHKSLHKKRRSRSFAATHQPASEKERGAVASRTPASRKKKATTGGTISPTVITAIAAPLSGLGAPPASAPLTVVKATGDSRTQITISAPMAPAAPLPTNPPARPQVETGLPVARPGSDKSTASIESPISSRPTRRQERRERHERHASSRLPPLVASADDGGRALSETSILDNFTFTNFSSSFNRRPKNFYPWKRDIITTIFWIGEGRSTISATTNVASAWDPDWRYNNGGTDSPYSRDGYATRNHVALINPFYVALPFNDLAFPDLARRWLPPGWSRPPRNGKAVSACKDRWVEIKNAQGDVCYAQWEDVGPLRYDHAAYVFGNERPETYTRAGLDVSPAVADYLHINSRNRYTNWRFVDAGDVQPGAWLLYDEQALLYKAILNGKNDPTRIQPVQDATAPQDDQSDIDSNKRRIGAAKG